MVFIVIVIILLLFGVVTLFAFPQLSPIPYFPSNPKDLKMILKFLNLRNNQVVVDLGAGDGIIIFKAATQSLEMSLNTEYIAIETNPVLVTILLIRRLLHKNRRNIHIVTKDLFKAHYSSLISKQINEKKYHPTFYLYISPWLIKSAVEQVQKTVTNFDVVSYFYPVPILKELSQQKGRNKIFYYKSKS